jgi:hypothetical protein
MVIISHNQIDDVIQTWDKVKEVDNFRDKAGSLIFNRLLELEPSARKLFGFQDGEDIKLSETYETHARSMVHMIDNAVFFLGGDLDPVKEDLIRLGKRHIRYGVDAAILPKMGEAVIHAVSELLQEEGNGTGLTEREHNAWLVIFFFFCIYMGEGMDQRRKALEGSSSH